MPDDVRILVTTTTRASPNGTDVYPYVAGEVYGVDSDPPMPADLAATFLREGWGERCGGVEILSAPRDCDDAEDAPCMHAPAREAPTESGPECLWCQAPYTARTGRGGPSQRFCSDACRAAFHRGARRWVARELEAGRLDIADLRED